MGRLIKVDGTEEEVHPKHNNRWTLKELQDLVGGWIEVMPGIQMRMVMNEEGRIRSLPFNQRATTIVLDQLKGQVLRYTPQIFGNVVIVDRTEKM